MAGILQSKAFQALNERSLGVDLGQFGMLSANQFAHLRRELDLPPTAHLLDLGCGLGKIAATLQAEFACAATGLDKDDEMLSEGRKVFDQSVDLVQGDFDALPWSEPTFDAIYTIDTLYFSKDLAALLSRLVRLLKPEGKLVIFWSQMIKETTDRSRLEAQNTEVASLLREMKLSFRFTDFTAEEKAYWEKAYTTLRELETDFRAEKEDELYDDFAKETEFMRSQVRGDRVTRYCYTVTLEEDIHE